MLQHAEFSYPFIYSGFLCYFKDILGSVINEIETILFNIFLVLFSISIIFCLQIDQKYK